MTAEWPDDADIGRAVAVWGQLLDEDLIADAGETTVEWPGDSEIAAALTAWGGIVDEAVDLSGLDEDSDCTMAWLRDPTDDCELQSEPPTAAPAVLVDLSRPNRETLPRRSPRILLVAAVASIMLLVAGQAAHVARTDSSRVQEIPHTTVAKTLPTPGAGEADPAAVLSGLRPEVSVALPPKPFSSTTRPARPAGTSPTSDTPPTRLACPASQPSPPPTSAPAPTTVKPSRGSANASGNQLAAPVLPNSSPSTTAPPGTGTGTVGAGSTSGSTAAFSGGRSGGGSGGVAVVATGNATLSTTAAPTPMNNGAVCQ